MAEDHLYVHVADDGTVLLSQESGSAVATPIVVSLEAAGARVVAARDIHPDARRDNGVTALMSSSYVGARHLVDDLIRRGIDLEERDANGYTALMYAANGGHDEVVAALVDAGADVDARDRQGSTPLMFAAQHGNLRSVKRLLVAGADATARRNGDGLTALDFAVMNERERVAAILRSVSGAG